MQTHLKKELREWYDGFRDDEEERLEGEGIILREDTAVMRRNHGYYNFMLYVISYLPSSTARYEHSYLPDNETTAVKEHEGALIDDGGDTSSINMDHRDDQTDSPRSDSAYSTRKHDRHPYVLALPNFSSQNLIAGSDTGGIKALID